MADGKITKQELSASVFADTEASLDSIETKVDQINSKATTANAKLTTIENKIDDLGTNSNDNGVIIFDEAGVYQWTCPEGVTKIWLTAIAAGGGGGGGARANQGSFTPGEIGGRGQFVEKFPMNVNPTENYAIVVGAGGDGGAKGSTPIGTSGATGKTGGITSFNGLALSGGTGGGGGRTEGVPMPGNTPPFTKKELYYFQNNPVVLRSEINGVAFVVGLSIAGMGGQGGNADMNFPSDGYKGNDGIIIIEW